MLRNDDTAFLVNSRDLGHKEIHILIVLKKLAGGVGNLR